MSTRRVLIVLAMAAWLAPSGAAYAEEGILIAHVSDTEGRSIEGVWLGTRGSGSTERTDRNGKVRIRLASGTQTGQWVTLQLRDSEEMWVFISPWDRRARVPPFDNGTESHAPVTLGKRGDRHLLESGGALKAMTANIVEQLGAWCKTQTAPRADLFRQLCVAESAKYSSMPVVPRLDLTKNLSPSPAAEFHTSLLGAIERERTGITNAQREGVLEEQAEAFGLRPEEVDQAIRAWRSRAEDPFDKGLAALYEENYPEAERDLRASLLAGLHPAPTTSS